MGNRHRAVSMVYNGGRNKDDEKQTQKSLAELKAVYKDIRYDWPQLVQGEVTPVEMAIAFLDDTSVGLAHRKADFDELCESMNHALRSAVVDNHESFTNSIGLYHQLLSIARETQGDSTEIKTLIETSNRDMKDRTMHLNDLDNSTSKYSEMLEILDAMEYLYKIPSQVDKLIVDQKIHEVYDVIAEAYKTATKYNLWSLSAMNATQNYLEMQSNNLYDMILDELKSEIYFKNFTAANTKESWPAAIQSSNPQITALKSLFTQLSNLEQYIYNSANLDIEEIARSLTENAENFLKNQLPRLHAHYSKTDSSKTDYLIVLDSALNPMSESCHYIYMLLHTASKLNKLEQVTEILLTSVLLEMHSLINHTTEECSQKNLQHLARLAKVRALDNATTYETISGQSFHDAAVPVIGDFFGSYFLKCLAIMLKHKVVSEIIKLIQLTHDLSNTSARDSKIIPAHTYSFDAVWALLRKEIESLIVSYIYEDTAEDHESKTDKSKSANSVQRVLAKKQLFQFEEVSYDSSLRSTDEMRDVLNEMFPGFHLNSQRPAVSGDSQESPYITTEKFSALVDVLVPKNIFNMRVILEFFLIFVAGLHRLFSNFEKQNSIVTAYQFFNEVMRKAFLTNLELVIDHSFIECMRGEFGKHSTNTSGLTNVTFSRSTVTTSEDATSFGPGNSGGSRVFLNAVQFRRLFTHACHTMNTSFTYSPGLSDVVLGLLEKFSSSYTKFYQELLSSGRLLDVTDITLGLHDRQSKGTLQIHQWMRVSQLIQTSGLVLLHRDSPEECAELVEREVELMFRHSNSASGIFDIDKDDLLDDETFDQVCYLLLTASWVLSWLPQMKKESNFVPHDKIEFNEIERLKYDWTFLENGRSPTAVAERTQSVFLTLNLQAMQKFDKVVQNFESIRDNALIALRYDLRLKGVYHIGQSFKDNFVLPTEPADADQFIILYNKEIYFIGTKIHDMLSSAEEDCVFVGLPAFINAAFMQGSELVRVANKNGIKKILLSIFTLQQMLRSVMKKEESVDLTKSSRFFEMFTESEQGLLQKIASRKTQYSRTQVLNLLRLIYSEKLNVSNASSFNKSKYNELLKKINDIFT